MIGGRQHRDYAGLAARLAPIPDRQQAMQTVVDRVWEAVRGADVSWVGFYEAAGDEMTLGPRRDKPACSPIGLHGACGAALLERTALVVRDVHALGAGYIACDPRDRSEIVIPLVDTADVAWGVFDADSFSVDAFTDADVNGMVAVLKAVGLLPGRYAPPIRVIG